MYIVVIVSFIFSGFVVAWMLNSYYKFTGGFFKSFFDHE